VTAQLTHPAFLLRPRRVGVNGQGPLVAEVAPRVLAARSPERSCADRPCPSGCQWNSPGRGIRLYAAEGKPASPAQSSQQ
jgi:hypothetical protein